MVPHRVAEVVLVATTVYLTSLGRRCQISRGADTRAFGKAGGHGAHRSSHCPYPYPHQAPRLISDGKRRSSDCGSPARGGTPFT